MKSGSTWGRRLAVTLSGAALLAMAAVPAMAQTPGGSQTQTGTINISEALSMTSTLQAFTLTNADTTTANAQGSGTLTVTSNDPDGYFIDLTGPSSFGAYDTGIVNYAAGSGDWASGTLTDSPVSVASADYASAPGGDVWTTGGFYLNQLPPSVGVAEAGTITYTLWGN